jgi:hypothetical protein
MAEGYLEMRVKVQDSVAAIEESVNSLSLDTGIFDTVPDLFNRIQKAIKDREEEGFDRLDFRYNEGFGYPTYIALRDSYKAGNPGKYSYSIIDFMILD